MTNGVCTRMRRGIINSVLGSLMGFNNILNRGEREI